MNICVFCSSNTSTPDIYKASASELGQTIAARKHTLVFGGGNVGLMRTTAESVSQSGGQVIGVIPEYLRHREKRFEKADELVLTDTISERKRIMIERSDAFIILPGGFGTLEEFFEVLAAKFRDLDPKPVCILNTAGFYNQLFGFFDFIARESVVEQKWRSAVYIGDDPDELLDYIEKHVHT